MVSQIGFALEVTQIQNKEGTEKSGHSFKKPCKLSVYKAEFNLYKTLVIARILQNQMIKMIQKCNWANVAAKDPRITAFLKLNKTLAMKCCAR